jgi:hypothetical protein
LNLSNFLRPRTFRIIIHHMIDPVRGSGHFESNRLVSPVIIGVPDSLCRFGRDQSAMHGQKKRRKRTMEGLIAVDGNSLKWRLVSEPQWTSEDGYIGLRISVQTEDAHHRELILEYPFPKKVTGVGLPQLPQRPKFSVKTIEASVRRAIAAGWDPISRGKRFVFNVG